MQPSEAFWEAYTYIALSHTAYDTAVFLISVFGTSLLRCRVSGRNYYGNAAR